MKKGNRRQARELALKVIYSLSSQAGPVEKILEAFWENFRFADDVLGEPLEESARQVSPEVRGYCDHLVTGVFTHLAAIDQCIDTCSQNWSIERMANTDLAILRLGVFELLYGEEIPASVVINEAIEIGKRYGTKETPSFVNGILDKIARNQSKSQ